MIDGGRLGIWAAFGTVAMASVAHAAPATLSMSESGDHARLTARWTDGRAAAPIKDVRVDGLVLIVTFADEFEADIAGLADGADATVSFARRDPDGRTLRIALRRPVVASLTQSGGVQVVELAAPAPAKKAAPPPSPDPLAELTVGKLPEFTRLSFLFPHGATVLPLLKNDKLELKFSRAADVDLSLLNITPPQFLKDAKKTSKPGQNLSLALMLAPGTRQRHFVEGSRVIVDLLPPLDPPKIDKAKEDAAKAAEEAKKAPVALPDPSPPSGIVRVTMEETSSGTVFTTRWARPARAAAFRRGGAIWILFEAKKARFDLNNIARVGRRHQDIQQIAGDGVVGLRIPVTAETLVSARADGREWSFTLAERAPPGGAVADVRSEKAETGSRLVAAFGRDGGVRWVEDPEIGDRFAVALLEGPVEGVDVRRATVEAAILPAAQGALIEPRADGVGAEFENGSLIVTRGAGLMLGDPAPEANAKTEAVSADDPFGPAPDVLMDLAAWGAGDKTRAIDVLEGLQRSAAVEGTSAEVRADARMALARFLLANELAAETLGALRVAAINQPLLEEDPQFRLMRAAANLMLGRRMDAQADLSASSLIEDSSAALWRGYSAALAENWPEARRALERGKAALYTQPRGWRVRFELALAESALELNDFAAAQSALAVAAGEAATDDAKAQAALLKARLMQARGDDKGALAEFDRLAVGRDEGSAVRATLLAVRLKRETGAMTPEKAAETLETLRFRWRGDAQELETIQTLGHVYEDMGRWREALSVMRGGAARFPDLPAARRLRLDMASAFERLFLDGEADRLDPIQALGLFYEFKDLAPVGASGDRMVRLLSARLVRMDLLEKASELLQYQVDNRLDGIAQSQVAADLAAIYVADGRPEKAIMAIENSRQPGTPPEIASDRRIIEAKALVQMARYDHATELLERDVSDDANRIRADIAWRQRNWTGATEALLAVLQRRPDETHELSEEDRAIVLRAAIACVLGGDDAALGKLKAGYTKRMATSPDADAFEMIVSGVDPGDARVRDIARRIARVELTDRVLNKVKALTSGKPAPKAAESPRA